MTEKIGKNESGETNPHIFNGNLELWMTDLPRVLKTVPIIQLAIPGSHNAMSYSIEKNNSVSPDEPKWMQVVGRYCSIISKPIIFNWSVTQCEDVTTQLNAGIRYLDLRLAAKPYDKGIFFVHGLYGAEVTKPLKLTNQWLSSHPGEVVILDCQHFYKFTKDTHRFFVDKIKNIFGEKMCPQTMTNLHTINLSWLSERKFQVLVIYRNEIAAVERAVWPSGLWPTPWPNTVDPHVMVEFLDCGLKQRNNNAGYVSQCLLTPNGVYVSKHPCGSLRKDLSMTCRNASLPWIARNKPGVLGLNIVITDYVCDDNFIFSRTVIQRNNELLESTLRNNYSQ